MIRAFQISTGLGAGNLGDDLMARAFWDRLADDIKLDVPLYPEAARLHEPYPQHHRYLDVDPLGNESAEADVPGLLVGDTPVTEMEHVQFPMRFLAPRLLHFHRRGLSVDAIGVGVDNVQSDEARQLFEEAYHPIRSWTVRSSRCKDALISLGVPESKVRVGADLAWRYVPRHDLREWAGGFWRNVGIDPSRPLLVANVVNLIWSHESDTRTNIAAALDEASARLGLQVAFFCNECRNGAAFDAQAARETAALMKRPAVIVPNKYFSPDEALALLRHATVTVGQRYHFVLETVLARSVPVGILRGEKMSGLAAELGIPVGGTTNRVEREILVAAIQDALEHRPAFLCTLDRARQELVARAEEDFSFMRELEPFRNSAGFGAADAGSGQRCSPNNESPAQTQLRPDTAELVVLRVLRRGAESRESGWQKELAQRKHDYDRVSQNLAVAQQELIRAEGAQQELTETIGNKTAELQGLRARVELERYRMRLQLEDQEKGLTSKDAEMDSLRVVLRGSVDEVTALRHQLETSLALRFARSLHWILRPLRRLIVNGPPNGAGT